MLIRSYRTYELPNQLERAIADFVDYYNHRRYHQALGYRTPAEAYASIPTDATEGGMVESLPLDTLRTAGPTLNMTPILS